VQIAYCYNFTPYFLRELFNLVGKDRSFIGKNKTTDKDSSVLKASG